VGEDGSLDRAGFQAGVTAHAVLGDDQVPARGFGVLTVSLLDAVDGTDVHAGALPFADVLHDFVSHASSEPPGSRSRAPAASGPGACGRARRAPTASSLPA